MGTSVSVPEPVERCGYTITPITTRSGQFNPVTGNMRIVKDGTWTTFPARLYEALTDEQFAAVAPKLFYQPESPALHELPRVHDGLMVKALTAHVVVPRESVEDGACIMGALGDMMNRPQRQLTDEEREANRARHEAERSARLAGLQAEWQALRDQYRDVPALLAVLDVHQPDEEHVGDCAHPYFGWEGDAEEWPCTTIEAIKGATS